MIMMKTTQKTVGVILLLAIAMLAVFAGCTRTTNPEQPTPVQQPPSESTQQDDLVTNEYNQPTVDKLDSDFDSLNSW